MFNWTYRQETFLWDTLRFSTQRTICILYSIWSPKAFVIAVLFLFSSSSLLVRTPIKWVAYFRIYGVEHIPNKCQYSPTFYLSLFLGEALAWHSNNQRLQALALCVFVRHFQLHLYDSFVFVFSLVCCKYVSCNV